MAVSKQQYINAFKAADKDGNGDLSLEELEDVLKSSGIPISQVGVSFLLEKLKFYV